MPPAVALQCIGVIRSPYRTKFGIPRQGGVARARATIELDPSLGPECTRGLEDASHLWVLFFMHAVDPTRRNATVRPPRLGGNRRLGVFATRSPFRPNPIGMSAVRLVGVEGLRIVVEGGDFLDETPVLDLKPYVPWADRIDTAELAWADGAPTSLAIAWTPAARAQLAALERPDEVEALIAAALAHDPRPAYRSDEPERRYGVRLGDHDVRFTIEGATIRIEAIRPYEGPYDGPP